MKRWAAFLRGMNVGGHRVTNAELRGVFDGLSLAEVGCFRASGNVVFEAEGGREALRARIEAALEDSLGYAVPTFLRSADELRAIAAHDPFPATAVRASAGKLQVVLLLEPPSASARRELLGRSTDEDRVVVAERELYWLPSGGLMESSFDWKAVAGLIGPTTVRTKGTVEQMTKKYLAA